MDINVEKVYQSPTTPVVEVSYLITFSNVSECDWDNNTQEMELIKFLENACLV